MFVKKKEKFHLFDIILLLFAVAFLLSPCYNRAMKKNSSPKGAKYFKYQFTPLLIILSVLVIVLCLAGMGVSIYRIVRFGVGGFTDALKSPLLIAICIFCIVLMISVLAKSQYIVDDTYYTTQFGFVKSKFPIKDVTKLELNMDTRKLTVYVGEEFSVLSLSPDWNDEFIAAIRAVKPEIEFTFTLAEKTDTNEK